MLVRMHIMVEKEEKERWIREGAEAGLTLTKWVRNRMNGGPQEEKDPKSIQGLKQLIKDIENKPKITRGSISRETYQKDEWVDPI